MPTIKHINGDLIHSRCGNQPFRSFLNFDFPLALHSVRFGKNLVLKNCYHSNVLNNVFQKKTIKNHQLNSILYYCNRNFQGQLSGQNKFIVAAVHIKEIGKDKSDPCGINNSDDDGIYKNFLFNKGILSL